MKTSTLITSVLFGTVLAQDAQIPLKDKAAEWFDKAKSFIPSVAPSVPDPLDSGAAAIAGKNVQKINIRNYQRLLQPKLEGEEEWIIYLTGGNKSCFGRCGKTDSAWTESLPLLTALPHPAGSPKLHLGRINCEKEAVLCAAWAASCPSIYHFTFPQLESAQQSSKPQSPLRIKDLNVTTTTPLDIVRLSSQAPNSNIMNVPIYDGAMHPVDGFLAKLGIQEYLGYLIWGMGSTPSWAIMIGISFLSRQFMGRRVAGRNAPDLYGGGGATGAGAAQPAPAPAAARPAAPASAGKGGKKRR